MKIRLSVLLGLLGVVAFLGMLSPGKAFSPPARSAPSLIYTTTLVPVAKRYAGCSSIYTVTNLSALTATAFHEFFTAGGHTSVYSFSDAITSLTSVVYDLEDLSGLPSGFTGTLTISATQPITAALEVCPDRSYMVYLPLTTKDWENLPEPVHPNDTYYEDYQWNMRRIRAPYAWAVTTGTSDIIVAVVDTGVDLTHPDLAGKLTSGYDFVNNDANPSDDDGHGTHVAGIVGALTNNSQGVAGVSWEVSIMPVKVLDEQGEGYHTWIANGIRWAADHGAQVINLSLGGSSGSSVLQEAINYAYNKGALVVAAAGNYYDQGNPVFYPAAYPHVLAVAATDDEDGHAYYSEAGYYVDVAAPGGSATSSWDPNPNHWIFSTYWRGAGYGDYASLAGTSQAAPHVSGLAALIWTVAPSLTNDQVEQVIEETAEDIGASGRDDFFGYGRIDAYRAVLVAPFVTSTGGAERFPPPETTLPAPQPDAPFEPGVVLVKFRPGVEETYIASILAQQQARLAGGIPALGVLRLRVPEGEEWAVVLQLLQDPAVEYAEPNYIAYAQGSRW